MSARLRKLGPLLLVCSAALLFGACGDSHSKVTTGTYAGNSGKNAPYLDVGPLQYQVQLSRQLNPANSEDAAYLKGLTPAEQKLAPGQEWFGVFLQVYNNGSESAPAATAITIHDTQGNVYTPLVPAAVNEFAYRAGTMRGEGRIPEPDTVASFGPIQGALLLYKIQAESLENRPLKIKILNPEKASESASAELDV